MERLHEQEVPFAPVYGTDEVGADPQVRHLGSMTFFPDRSVRNFTCPLSFSQRSTPPAHDPVPLIQF